MLGFHLRLVLPYLEIYVECPIYAFIFFLDSKQKVSQRARESACISAKQCESVRVSVSKSLTMSANVSLSVSAFVCEGISS